MKKLFDDVKNLKISYADLICKCVVELGFDGFIYKNNSPYGGLIVVYNVKKLNNLLKQGDIKLK